MKKLTLGLSLILISGLAMADGTVKHEENNVFNLEQYQKDLNNPDFFKSHQISIMKEEKRHFLFFPYTKEVPVSNIQLTGVETMFFSGYEKPYISSITKKENEETIIENSIVKSGITVQIKKSNDKIQTLSFNSTDLLSINSVKTEDGLMIQLPNTESQSLSLPISSESFVSKWKSQDGTVYHLRYNGQKTLPKS